MIRSHFGLAGICSVLADFHSWHLRPVIAGPCLVWGFGGDGWEKTIAMMDNVGINYKGRLPQARRQQWAGEVSLPWQQFSSCTSMCTYARQLYSTYLQKEMISVQHIPHLATNRITIINKQ
jgi:hypothetical protein